MPILHRSRRLGGRIARKTLARLGVTALRTRNVPYGFDWLLDVERIGRSLGIAPCVFFDVGANDGTISLQILQRFPEARIHAFEPHPVIFAELSRTLDGRARCHELALGERPETRTLYSHPYHKMSSLLPQSPANTDHLSDGTYAVAVSTLDRFCEEQGIPAIDVLKIDAEGTDLDVLRGAQGLLDRRAIRFVLVEFNEILDAGRVEGALQNIAALLRPADLRFVTQYTQWVRFDDFFVVSDALFVLPSRAA